MQTKTYTNCSLPSYKLVFLKIAKIVKCYLKLFAHVYRLLTHPHQLFEHDLIIIAYLQNQNKFYLYVEKNYFT